MNEQDIFDEAINCRINSLVQELRDNAPDKELDAVLDNRFLAMKIITRLPQDQQAVLYQELYQTSHDLNDVYLTLYKGGVIDGIHIMKHTHNLYI